MTLIRQSPRARCGLLSLCLLLSLLSACSLPGAASDQPTPAPTTSAPTNIAASSTATTTPQTEAMPKTETACPTDGQARAAVMRTLVLGANQNLIYIYNEVPDNTSASLGHLRRYDVSNGHKAEVASSGLRIEQAQVSQDGQWVLFLSIPDPRADTTHSAMLQLVRLDGQGLQTLYCFPSTTYVNNSFSGGRLPISLQWSTDEASIVVSQNTTATPSQAFLLDTATGNITQLFADKQSSFAYTVLTWLDKSHFYLLKQPTGTSASPATLYLVNAETSTAATPALSQVLPVNTHATYYSFDSSWDNTRLFSSTCTQGSGLSYSSSLLSEPATGGSANTIYQNKSSLCIRTIRVIGPNMLLLLVQSLQNNNFQDQVWSYNLETNATTNLVTLTSQNSGQGGFSLNPTSQYTWSNISRDDGYYALQARDPVATNQTILVGPLNGGAVTAVAVTNPGASSVSLVGWSRL